MTGDGGLIALTVEECDELLVWSDAAATLVALGSYDNIDLALRDRLIEWRKRHHVPGTVRGY